MDPSWLETFRARMRGFEMRRPPQPGAVSVSIKVRVVSGCFHRSCSPHAYALIYEHLRRTSSSEPEFAFEEHESGPEILVYVAAGVSLAASIINLVTTIIRARSEGVKKGDRPSEPVELVVRRTVGRDSIQDEVVLKYDHADPVSAKVIEERLNEALGRLLGVETKKLEYGVRASQSKPKRKRI
jgi:hypothetical protein